VGCVGTIQAREADFGDIFVSEKGELIAPVFHAEAAGICPSCGAVYRSGFPTCSDCQVPVCPLSPSGRLDADIGVDFMNQEIIEPTEGFVRSENMKLEVVFTSSHVSEAHLIKSLLEANGIDVYSFDENWLIPVREVKLAVTHSQEELAREILEEYRGKAG